MYDAGQSFAHETARTTCKMHNRSNVYRFHNLNVTIEEDSHCDGREMTSNYLWCLLCHNNKENRPFNGLLLKRYVVVFPILLCITEYRDRRFSLCGRVGWCTLNVLKRIGAVWVSCRDGYLVSLKNWLKEFGDCVVADFSSLPSLLLALFYE
jgi:hypothetical protein